MNLISTLFYASFISQIYCTGDVLVGFVLFFCLGFLFFVVVVFLGGFVFVLFLNNTNDFILTAYW